MYCIEQIGARAPDKTNLLFLPPVALPTVTSVISPLFIENLPTKIITAALKLRIITPYYKYSSTLLIFSKSTRVHKMCKSVERLLTPDLIPCSLGKMVTALRICNFMVENMRSHLKLQVEKYFIILMNIVVADPSKGKVRGNRGTHKSLHFHVI